MRRLLVVVLSMSACAAELRPLPVRMDASNPDAPEALPLPGPTAFAKPAEAGRSSAPAARRPGAAVLPRSADGAPPSEAMVYSCPMHPEVEQAGPGRCPKCGMELVPSTPGAAPPQGASGSGDGQRDPAEHPHDEGDHP